MCKRRLKLPNLDNRDVVKCILYILSHLLHVLCLWATSVDQLCSPLVLLNEVKLTMVLRIEITDVTSHCNELLQVRLLILKIKLHE